MWQAAGSQRWPSQPMDTSLPTPSYKAFSKLPPAPALEVATDNNDSEHDEAQLINVKKEAQKTCYA
jgi:hypothetical protein